MIEFSRLSIIFPDEITTLSLITGFGLLLMN